MTTEPKIRLWSPHEDLIFGEPKKMLEVTTIFNSGPALSKTVAKKLSKPEFISCIRDTPDDSKNLASTMTCTELTSSVGCLSISINCCSTVAQVMIPRYSTCQNLKLLNTWSFLWRDFYGNWKVLVRVALSELSKSKIHVLFGECEPTIGKRSSTK